MQGRFRVLRGFAVHGLLLFGLAGCASVPADSEKPEFWRITQTDATSTCIGDPKTPLCAVETLIACGARRDLRLCRIAGVDKDVITSYAYTLEYDLKRMHVLRPEDIPPHLKGVRWFQPGMVVIDNVETQLPRRSNGLPRRPLEIV